MGLYLISSYMYMLYCFFPPLPSSLLSRLFSGFIQHHDLNCFPFYQSDCWNRPIRGSPGAWISVLPRVSFDGNKTMELEESIALEEEFRGNPTGIIAPLIAPFASIMCYCLETICN